MNLTVINRNCFSFSSRVSRMPRVIKVLYQTPGGDVITRNDAQYVHAVSPMTSAVMPAKAKEKMKLGSEPERLVLRNFKELEIVSPHEGEFFILGGNQQGFRTIAQHCAKRWIQSQTFYNARLSQIDRIQAEARDTGRSFTKLLADVDAQVAVKRYAKPGYAPVDVGTILAEQHLNTLRGDDFSRKDLTGPFGQINLAMPHFMVSQVLEGRLPDLLIFKLNKQGGIKKLHYEKA